MEFIIDLNSYNITENLNTTKKVTSWRSLVKNCGIVHDQVKSSEESNYSVGEWLLEKE